MSDDLRDRIATAIESIRIQRDGDAARMTDAVIRELDDAFLDFGTWLAEEITGKTMTRIDLESCLQEWKWLHDESRWIKDEGND